MDDPHVHVEHAFHLVVFTAGDTKIGDLLEMQDFRQEGRFPVDIANREADHFHPLHIAGQTVARMSRMGRQCRHHQRQNASG